MSQTSESHSGFGAGRAEIWASKEATEAAGGLVSRTTWSLGPIQPSRER